MRSRALRGVREIGRYHLHVHDEIGAGGMATVHLAWKIDESRVVAIKRLRGDLARDPDFVDMFKDEARVAMRIAHPNVVAAIELLSADNDWFLVMEYVRGAALSQLIRRALSCGARVPAPVAIAIAVGMLRGLQASHEVCDENGAPLNVIHRDVSPQNVIVGIDGRSRLVDFGVAKAKGRLQVTQVGELKGKLPYMAPEQLDEAAVTPATDVYAASAVLWETLCGQRLFHDDADRPVDATEADEPAEDRSRFDARRRRYAGITPPSERGAQVSPELDQIVLRGLHRLQARRFQTAGEMADALAACGPVASEAEVGAWVQSLNDPELGAREMRVAEMERYGRGEDDSAPVSAVVQRASVTALELTRRVATVEYEPLLEESRRGKRLRLPTLRRRRLRQLVGAALLSTGVIAGIGLEEIARPMRGASSAGTAPVSTLEKTRAAKIAIATRSSLAAPAAPELEEAPPPAKTRVHHAPKRQASREDEIPAMR